MPAPATLIPLISDALLLDEKTIELLPAGSPIMFPEIVPTLVLPPLAVIPFQKDSTKVFL